MTDGEARVDPPFGRFRVRTEPMGDGREIHYYEWPEGTEDEPDGEPADPGAADPAGLAGDDDE